MSLTKEDQDKIVNYELKKIEEIINLLLSDLEKGYMSTQMRFPILTSRIRSVIKFYNECAKDFEEKRQPTQFAKVFYLNLKKEIDECGKIVARIEALE